MPKFKIKKTNILIDKKVVAEGSEVELSEEQAAKLSDFLIPIEDKKPLKASENNTSNKTTTKSATKKTEDETKTENTETDGGNK